MLCARFFFFSPLLPSSIPPSYLWTFFSPLSFFFSLYLTLSSFSHSFSFPPFFPSLLIIFHTIFFYSNIFLLFNFGQFFSLPLHPSIHSFHFFRVPLLQQKMVMVAVEEEEVEERGMVIREEK